MDFDCLIGSRSTFNGCTAADNSWTDGVIQNGSFDGFKLSSGFDGVQFEGCRSLNSPSSGIRGGQNFGMNFLAGAASNRITGGRYDDNLSGAFGNDTAANGFLYLDASLRPTFGS